MGEGDAARDAGKHEEAANKYRGAYYSLPPVDRVSFIGSLAVNSAMGAFDQMYQAKRDPLVLQAQIVLADEFLRDVEAVPDGKELVGPDVIEEVRKSRKSAQEKLPAPKVTKVTKVTKEEPVDCPIVTPDVKGPIVVEPKRKENPTDKRRPNWLGIGLVAGGGVTLGVGAGVLAGWWTVRREAANYVELAPGYEEGTDARASYLARQEKEAQAFRIAGAVLVSLGAATAAGGLVHILLRRRGGAEATPEKRTAIVPSVGFNGASVVLTRRF